MSIDISTTVNIAATPDEIWDALTDFSSYGEWSNFSSIDGTAEVGSRLTMRMPGMSFRSTVEAAVPGRELRWGANIITDRIFLGQHSFVITDNGDGTSQLTNSETFSGVLVRPFQRFFAHADNSRTGYAAFNQSLKRRLEGRVHA